MKWIIRPAVLELLLEPAADLDPVIGRDGNITTVEEAVEAVEVAPQQQPVAHAVRAALVERPDMGGFERG